MEKSITPYKPLITKRTFLLISGIVWFIIGILLINRCTEFLIENSRHIVFHFSIGIFAGLFLYLLLFFNVSKKYIHGILHLDSNKPHIISFTNFRLYFIISLIIGIGYTLRQTDNLNNIHIAIAYICFGFTLILSSFKIVYSFFAFNKLANQKDIPTL